MKPTKISSQKQTLSSGFTLIELMIVIAILSIITAIAIPAYNGYVVSGRKSECNNEVATIMLSQSQFFLENNSYFQAGTAAALQANSGGFYTASAEALAGGTTNCTYVVQPGTTGNIATSYTVIATGANKLASEGIIVTKNVN